MQKVNYFHCPNCGRVTKHIEISFTEFVSIKGAGIAYKASAGIFDLLGITQGVSKLMGYGYYKCCDCGLANQREPNGEINEEWNKRK